MWTGSQALKSIDQGLMTLRNDVGRLDAELEQLTERVNRDRRARLKLINSIASVRLSALESGEVIAELDAADREVETILDQRRRAARDLDLDIAALTETIEKAEKERDQALEAHLRESQELLDLEANVQSQLKDQVNFLNQYEEAKQAESIAEEAAQKVSRAQQDLAKKAIPYKADKLFMYLWNRGFGTTEYRAGLFVRFMDSFVAKTINYEPARVNYWNLTEIPKRLAEHAASVANKADEAHMALRQIELSALEAAGKPKLEQELEEQRQALDTIDDNLERAEQELNQLLSKRSAFLSGEDPYSQSSVARLARALDHKSMQAVFGYVRQTTSLTDDKLARELKRIDERNDAVDDDLRDVRQLHEHRLDRLKELEDVRRNFKNARFDDLRSGFRNEAMLANALNQFLAGALSGNDVWRMLKRNQRYRDIGAMPDFGSGSLGEIADILGDELIRTGRKRRRRHGSTWHFPKPRRGGGGFRFPSGGGSKFPSGGGGFKTGGGF